MTPDGTPRTFGDTVLLLKIIEANSSNIARKKWTEAEWQQARVDAQRQLAEQRSLYAGCRYYKENK